MIIKNSSVIPKKYRIIILVISLVLDISLITLTVLSTILTFFSKNSIENFYVFIFLLIAVIGALSISDIILIIGFKNSIIFYIIKKIQTKKNFISISRIKPTEKQLSFCESIAGKISNKKLIHLCGEEGKGKTTATFYLIYILFINSRHINEIKKLNNIIFIDCKNNKEEIIDFFSNDDFRYDRIQKFNGYLIVLDNIECLGQLFIENNMALFSSEKNDFILIEDILSLNSIIKEEKSNNSLCTWDFKMNRIKNNEINLLEKIKTLSNDEKQVFYILYILSINNSYIKKHTLRDIIHFSKIKFKNILKKIRKAHLFIEFPFNSQYLYFFDKHSLKDLEQKILNDPKYYDAIESIMQSKIVDDESKWHCFIRQKYNFLKNISEYNKMEIFKKAIKKANYKSLYTDLRHILKFQGNKREIFLFEKGVLAFYNGYHLEATDDFNELIKKETNEEKKKELMIRIIESSHGSTDKTNMDLINSFIEELNPEGDIEGEKKLDIYAIYSFYWKIHIMSERGLFHINQLRKIRNALNNHYTSVNDVLKRSIIQRTYTDEIRFAHILGKGNFDALYADYNKYLSSCDKNRLQYFSNLYTEANHLHYYVLMKITLGDPQYQENIEECVMCADEHYDNALSSSYNDEKSKRATRIKQYDLKMMYSDFDFKKTMDAIGSFRIHSEVNQVEVHQAFCNTMSMKALILNPNNFENYNGYDIKEKESIYTFADKARKIYIDYDNQYGLFRIDFILLLLEILLSPKNELKGNFEKLEELIKNNPSYTKEKEIFNAMKEKEELNRLTNMFIISIIRAYPIILQ